MQGGNGVRHTKGIRKGGLVFAPDIGEKAKTLVWLHVCNLTCVEASVCNDSTTPR